MFVRQLKLALQNFYRNFWLSLATVVIILLSLFSVSILFAIGALSQGAIDVLEDKINISVYLKSEVGVEKTQQISKQIEAYPEVKKVTQISREEALEDFRLKHQDNELLQDSLGEIGDNPFGNTLIIEANSTADYSTIIDKISEDDFVDLVENQMFNDDYKGIITKLNQLSSNVKWVMLGLISLFVVISTLIIINTIRITIYTYREEIGIMRLVGATQGFIRSPFLIQGFIYGAIAWGVHLALLYPVLSIFQPYVNNFLGSDGINLSQYFTEHFFLIFGFELLGVLALNLLSSAIAMRKYLRT